MNLHQTDFKKIMILGGLFLFTAIQLTFGQSKVQELDKLLQLYHEYGKFNGSALVAEQGKVIYKNGLGMANMEWDIENQTNTKHRLGSITKQFTAMLILQLAEEGKLDLNAPVSDYLPDYPNDSDPKITTHHLLTHTSGIPNYTAFPGFFKDESRDPYSPDDFIKKFEDKELEFTPGERFNYSNSGYFLLGVIIEKVSGKSYEEMLQEKIFTPLNMTGSGYDHHDEILKNRATGYEKQGRNYINSRYIDMTIPYAAGSLYSTVEDLYLWDQALYTNKLLSKEYMELYFKPYVKAFGETHYAYGWGVGYDRIGNSKDSVYTISHGGGINGFNTIISRSPSDKTLVVLLNNTGGAPLSQMTRSIRGVLKGTTYDLPKKSAAYEMQGVIEDEGIDAGVDRFNKIKDDKTYDLDENEMNQIGYQLMGKEMVEEASKVFKLNMDAFPESFNVYDSYAEAQMKLGNNEEAIEYYKKSVEMNPGNQNGIDMLKKLGVDIADETEEVVVPDEILESYVGKYELSPGFVLTITKEGSQLSGQATGQPKVDIFPKSETLFYLKVVMAQIEFNKSDNGKIESLTLYQNGQEMTGKRLAD
ncbi:serine hydrolase [Lutimonas zeaxanthinifaciens]|uniref:serine hydrolase n=1 Tax=Lutimonas zeaxanthinifaciens TaxID=3060215 RepID=UPI00265CD2E1|nr:serine hydrolase [Lutimonas sp. YSD2104]WKK66482.1 serine hydrolase [Lutimonas sp. YSD2104]